VKLTIEEEAGAARSFGARDHGRAVRRRRHPERQDTAMKDAAASPWPCQFEEVSRWHSDKGGVRWAHADLAGFRAGE